MQTRLDIGSQQRFSRSEAQISTLTRTSATEACFAGLFAFFALVDGDIICGACPFLAWSGGASLACSNEQTKRCALSASISEALSAIRFVACYVLTLRLRMRGICGARGGTAR